MASRIDKKILDKLILRDHLAMERTTLANQRTLLAYIRTAVSFFGAGIALVKVIDIPSFIAIGWVFMIASPLLLAFGFFAYQESKRRVKESLQRLAEDIENK
ncbi:MAG: DUF202 domain-containing protein [Clostridia bacterium]|jgi:Predicted membrane protein|nr:DUF202 domain-containing protein [Clostridia bacterium]MBQ9342833.1 DUF202 domain-containing protein [Clostridia bacterium]MBR6300650.1 DUF202 domain-containing protein [Clostridia bacterium]